jgi:beta-N-acetylhexosaminidase
MPFSAFICGAAGQQLSDWERAFLREHRPCGFILFARNISTPAQVQALIESVQDCVGESGMLILSDQEGGRVQRFGPPHWPRYPTGRAFGELYAANAPLGLKAAKAVARLIAADLHGIGVNMNCAPVADLLLPGASSVIGDRAYGSSPLEVAALAGAFADGLLEGGVLPVIKHIPGHGRARSDSHFFLPRVTEPLAELEVSDFAAFKALNAYPAAMTAHLILQEVDCAAPVTVSKTVVQTVIRDMIGFKGLLMSDDLSMKALSGTMQERAAASFAAGCDLVLHCNGNVTEMTGVAEASPALGGDSLHRFETAMSHLQVPQDFDREQAEAFRMELLAAIA